MDKKIEIKLADKKLSEMTAEEQIEFMKQREDKFEFYTEIEENEPEEHYIVRCPSCKTQFLHKEDVEDNELCPNCNANLYREQED